MRRLLSAVLMLAMAAPAGATNLTWGQTNRVPVQSLTVTVANCTSNGTTTLTTTDDFNLVQTGMTIITGGTLGIATGARVLSKSGKSLTMNMAAGSGTGTATFTFPVKVSPVTGEVLMGVNPSDTSGVPFQFEGASGGLMMTDVARDRDFPLITQLFSGQNLVAAATYSMPVGVPLIQYTRAAIMLTWAAAIADTDSVRIAVRVYGLTSSTSSNWHLWTPETTHPISDTCVTPSGANDTTSAGHGRCTKPVTWWVLRSDQFARWTSPLINASMTSLYQGTALTAGTRLMLRKIDKSGTIKWGSANGVMLNLVDNAGAPCPFPYIRIEVYNASGQGCTLSNVEANIWPRVQ